MLYFTKPRALPRTILRCPFVPFRDSTTGIRPTYRSIARFSQAEKAQVDASPASRHHFQPKVRTESTRSLRNLIKNPTSTYQTTFKAFTDLRSRGVKLDEHFYLSLLYKASREDRVEQVWQIYKAFLEDERQENVNIKPRAPTTWPSITSTRMHMHRFVLWAMLDTVTKEEMESFYQTEVIGKRNTVGIYEADPFNFLLSLECTTRVADETDDGLRQRVETLLSALDRVKLHTSYSSFHRLVRLMLYRPEVFLTAPVIKEETRDEVVANHGTKYPAKAIGNLVLAFMDRFPFALSLDPKRLSIAVSAAAAAGLYDAAKVLLQHGAIHHVPIEAGSFAHAVECAPDDASRMQIADLYIDAKEHERIYTIHDADNSVVNYLLLYAILDGNFKHMMEILHEMQLCNNRISNRTVDELFRSIAQYRAKHQRQSTRNNDDETVVKCPTILELLETFPNAIPYTTHTFSQGIRQSLRAGDLSEALELMRIAFWSKDVKLRPEIYSQLLYPLLGNGQQDVDKSNTKSTLDPQEVERYYDKAYPNERAVLNSLLVNLCQSNEDISSLLVCLDRWQTQGHPPMSRRVVNRIFDAISKQIQQLRKQNQESTPDCVFFVQGMKLSYMAFLVRYRKIIPWDAWTFERAIVRARTSGMQGDVVLALAQATAKNLVLNSLAYIVALCVLDEIGEPSAIVACVENMKANNAWEKAVIKNPNVQTILDRALDNIQLQKDQGV